MLPEMHTARWMRLVLVAIVLLCVLGAATPASSHIHFASGGRGDLHCSLCALAAALVAVVVALTIGIVRSLTSFLQTRDSEVRGSNRFYVHLIRPPPQVESLA